VNEFIHNGKGNAPPEERQKAKSKRQKACSTETFSFVLFPFSLTSGMRLLNMRDGPRGRAPATRFAMVNGLVTLIQKSSVSLCVHSVNSAVKKERNHGETQRSHREGRAINALIPTKEFRTHCTENGRCRRILLVGSLSVQSQLAVRHPERTCPDRIVGSRRMFIEKRTEKLNERNSALSAVKK